MMFVQELAEPLVYTSQGSAVGKYPNECDALPSSMKAAILHQGAMPL